MRGYVDNVDQAVEAVAASMSRKAAEEVSRLGEGVWPESRGAYEAKGKAVADAVASFLGQLEAVLRGGVGPLRECFADIEIAPGSIAAHPLRTRSAELDQAVGDWLNDKRAEGRRIAESLAELRAIDQTRVG